MTAVRNYICQDCDYEWEYLHHPNVDDDPSTVCPDCLSPNFEQKVGLKSDPVTIVQGNHDFVHRQRARLTKRSTEHYKRSGRDEAIQRQDVHWKSEGIIE